MKSLSIFRFRFDWESYLSDRIRLRTRVYYTDLEWLSDGTLINGVVVPGFAFLASIIAIFGGGQLFAIGMIGEYLARMHWRSMNRPPFAIAETLGGDDTLPD